MKINQFIRIRKPAPNPKKYLRLHRAEFGDNFDSKSPNLDKFYPDSTDLIFKLAKFHKVNFDQIVVGLGGESLIKDILLWHYKKNKKSKILNSSSNYFMYTFYSKLFDYKIFYYNIYPEKKSSPSVKSIKKILNKNKINLLVLVNPSSPIEKNWSMVEIKEILNYCKKKKIIVIIDEVYQLLGSKSSISLIKKYNNLIILRSLSKAFGYPGIRMGYIITSKTLKEGIESFRLAIELPSDTIIKSKKIIDKFNTTIKKNILKTIEARKFANQEFRKRSIKSFGEYSNSVCFKFDTVEEKNRIVSFLKKKKILINDGFKNHLSKYASITTTNKKNIKFFFKNLDKVRK